MGDQKKRKLIGWKEALRILGVSKTTLYTNQAYPRPVRMSQGRLAWVEDEIYAFVEKCISERDNL